MNKNILKLYKHANFDPSKERKDQKLEHLLNQIEEGYVVLPIFQTYIRWTTKKMVDLFNYQLLGKSPVAPISVNAIDNPDQVIEQIGFLDREILDKDNLVGKNSVVDGQQRLSTNYKAYIDHKDVQNIVLDLQKGKFISLKNNEVIKDHQMPVGKLYNKDHQEYLKYLHNVEYLKQDDIKDLLDSIRKKHQHYSYVVNFASNLTKEEQMEWFEVLNLAGSRITGDMVYLTDMLVKGVDFYKEYVNPFMDKLEESKLKDLIPRKTAEVSIALASLNAAYFKVTGAKKKGNISPIPSDTNAKLIGKCSKESIQEIVNKSLKALDDTLEIIKTHNLTEYIYRIDIITYIMGLLVDKDIDINHITREQENYIITFIKEVDFINKSNSKRRQIYNELLNNYPSSLLKENQKA